MLIQTGQSMTHSLYNRIIKIFWNIIDFDTIEGWYETIWKYFQDTLFWEKHWIFLHQLTVFSSFVFFASFQFAKIWKFSIN